MKKNLTSHLKNNPALKFSLKVFSLYVGLLGIGTLIGIFFTNPLVREYKSQVRESAHLLRDNMNLKWETHYGDWETGTISIPECNINPSIIFRPYQQSLQINSDFKNQCLLNIQWKYKPTHETASSVDWSGKDIYPLTNFSIGKKFDLLVQYLNIRYYVSNKLAGIIGIYTLDENIYFPSLYLSSNLYEFGTINTLLLVSGMAIATTCQTIITNFFLKVKKGVHIYKPTMILIAIYLVCGYLIQLSLFIFAGYFLA